MPDGWRESTWGEEVTLNYGKAIRGYQNGGGTYRVFGSNGPVGWHTEWLARGPGVILGRKGAYRGVRYSQDPFFVIDTAYFLTPKSEMDMRWLYYAVIHNKLGEIDDGSPIPSTTRAAVYVRPLEVPPIEEQRQIASILGSLDDKIELNRQMNEKLEAMAQAIFRDWFVNFGPTRRKIEGASDPVEIMGGLVTDAERAQQLADLFPARVGDNELPEGWKKRSIYDYSKVIYGAPFSSKRFNASGMGRPLARIRDLSKHEGGVFTDEIHKKEYVIRAGDIVVGMDGEFRAYIWHGNETLMNQRVCSFSPINAMDKALVYLGIQPLLAKYESTAIGTTVIHLGKKEIDDFGIVSGGALLDIAFGALVEPLLAMAVLNGQQCLTLGANRDLLLPKLMSGDIRLREAEEVLEAAQ